MSPDHWLHSISFHLAFPCLERVTLHGTCRYRFVIYASCNAIHFWLTFRIVELRSAYFFSLHNAMGQTCFAYSCPLNTEGYTIEKKIHHHANLYHHPKPWNRQHGPVLTWLESNIRSTFDIDLFRNWIFYLTRREKHSCTRTIAKALRSKAIDETYQSR